MTSSLKIPKVTELTLSNNLISSFSPSLNSNISSIRILDLRQNKIKAIAPLFWKQVPSLQSLRLSYNSLTTLGEFSQGIIPTKLVELTASFNRLYRLPQQLNDAVVCIILFIFSFSFPCLVVNIFHSPPLFISY